MKLRQYQIDLINQTRALMQRNCKFDIKAWREENRPRLLKEKCLWYKKNRRRILAKKKWLTPHARLLNKEASRRWRENNREKKLQVARDWSKRNREYGRFRFALRRARILQATPAWINIDDIKSIYFKASKQKKHVDHIVPLVHPLVCGLHVPWNLQLLKPFENFHKNNRWPYA